MVGKAVASGLVGLGHDVMMGARTREHDEAKAWLASTKGRGKTGTFAEAARFGDVLLNCTQGAYTLDALRAVDKKDIAGKVLIDIANPLDMSQQPPTLTICNTDSLGEAIQREFPEAKVVKALNTVNCEVMINPRRVPGEHDLFICGNDAGAKETVKALLREFGWKSIIDMGDITNARATEQLLPIWIRLFMMFGSADFNFKVVKA
jgi:predicted dinucleotide-binding enzyme